MDINSNSKCRA